MPEHFALPTTDGLSREEGLRFLQLLEVYVDDFIQMAQTTDEAALRHCSRAILHGIHSVFPPPEISGHSGEDPISLKKLLAGEGLWEVRKEVLGWVMDGATRCIELAEKKQEAILSELRKVLRMRRGVPLKRMQRLVGKLRHASIGIPAGKYLFGPINRLMAREHKFIFWDRVPEAARALRDLGQLLREAATEPTHVKELVPGPPAYKATLDASGEGAGGVWVHGDRALAPIVWRLRWPPEVVARLVTPTNLEGDITNSDLEMAAEVLGWLVLEANMPLRHAHVGICSDNLATVFWQLKGGSRNSAVANRLLRVLAMRMRANRASPLVTRHIAGECNDLGDIPSRSFGYKPEWHYEDDDEFLAFFNKRFPLPHKNSSTGFCLSSEVSSRVICELLTHGSPMAAWRQLPKIGTRFGANGQPTADISECLRIWTDATTKRSRGSQQPSVDTSAKLSGENSSALATFEPSLATSRHRSNWTGGNSR
ncbi:hypothetical protein ACHAWF_011783 [Thalassiosira exigua]